MKKLLQQALDVIEAQQSGLTWYRTKLPECVDNSDGEMDIQACVAISNLLATIAEPESEPVAWMADSGTCVKPDERLNKTYYHIPLYAHP